MDDIERGKHAKAILDNPMYREAMTAIKADLFNQWSSKTIWSGTKKREKIWSMMQAVIEFENKFKSALTDAQVKMKYEEKKAKLRKVL